MKINQKKQNDLMLLISIEVGENDYSEKVSKVLADYRKTVEMPGFRKGKTPAGIINMKYGVSVLVDEVNKLLQDNLYKYIADNKLRVLGSPMPVDGNTVDWKNSKNFNFEYEVGLAPDFDFDISSKDKLVYYTIQADNKIVDRYCLDLAKKYGKMSNVESSKEGDLIFCSIQQLDADGNIFPKGIQNDATVSMDYISEKSFRDKFVNLIVGDKVILNIKKVFSSHADLAAMLNIDQDRLMNLQSNEFSFTVKNISRLTPAEMNVNLFDKLYEVGTVTNKKEFKSKVKKEAENQLIAESDRMLKNDVVTYFLDKLDLKMPDDFLKRWLIQTSKQPITMDILDKEYETYAQGLKWQLIENKILEKYNIKVSEDDVLEYAKKLIRIQMKQYGQPEGSEKKLNEIALNILKSSDEKKKLYDQLYDSKTLEIYKEKFNLKKKTISYSDFVKLATEK